MSDYILGSIPEKVKYFSVEDITVSWDWANFKLRQYTNKKDNELKHVTWIFPANASNKPACTTAEKRAKAYSEHWKTRQKTGKTTASATGLTVIDNVPMTGLRIVGIQHGSSNSIEYVVLLPGNYVMTMPYDSLMDALTLGGIGDNGTLKGEYIFAQADGKMELVRIGSAFYKGVVEATERSKASNIKELKLVPGHLYRNRAGEHAVFVGFVNTVNYKPKYNKLQKQIIDRQYIEEVPYKENYEKLELSSVAWKMATVWTDVWLQRKKDDSVDQEAIKLVVQDSFSKNSLYSVKLLKNHSYMEEVENFDIDIPLDFFEKLRRSANADIELHLEEFKKGKTDTYYDRINFNYEVEDRLLKEALAQTPKPAVDMTVGGFRSLFKNEIEAAEKWRRRVLTETYILTLSSWANVMIFGMPAIVNSHIEKIVNSYK
ncbi:MAG: hypothetical protein WC761_01905 [Candidatus Paceibacterota bacterium]|jgi:hypothetical protein